MEHESEIIAEGNDKILKIEIAFPSDVPDAWILEFYEDLEKEVSDLDGTMVVRGLPDEEEVGE